MTSELPQDIVFNHILPRLPAKSALRFKCVSKRWRSFLKTRKFANMNLHYQTRYKLLVEFTTRSSCPFHSFDCETPEDGLTGPLPFPLKLNRHQQVSIITSCNGLVCIGISRKCMKDRSYYDLMLWNPFTGDHKTLSKINAHKESYNANGTFLFYYISSKDDYKLLHVMDSSNVYIYSLKYDLWRKINPTDDFHTQSCLFGDHSASLNEQLYIVKEKAPNSYTYSIIRLDLKSEKLREVSSPFFEDSSTYFMSFTVVRGCLHVWTFDESEPRPPDPPTELWRMDGDGEWIKVASCWGTSYFQCGWRNLEPMHVMANGNWLMFDENCLYKRYPVEVVNPKCTSNYTVYDYSDKDKDKDKNINIPPKGKYLETLVSPNQYMK